MSWLKRRNNMAKQRAPLEFKTLSGGIITEASPLSFPDSASIDEANFELRQDGSRRRRLGFELELESTQLDTNLAYSLGSPSVVNSFSWKNVSGIPSLEFIVIQFDGSIAIYNTDKASLSSGLEHVLVIEDPFKGNRFDFALLDGNLVIVSGSADIYTVLPDVTDLFNINFELSTSRLTIRDLFGVQVMYDRSVEVEGVEEADLIDLTDPLYITKRPMPEGLPGVDEGAFREYTGPAVHFTSPDLGTGPDTEHIATEALNPPKYTGYSISYL